MNDRDIRYPLANLLGKGGRVLGEVGLWGNHVRVDLLHLADTALHGYEIKSDSDTLSRLRRQADTYNLVLERVTLVATHRHLSKAEAMVPRWWGLTEACERDGEVTFAELRAGERNPSQSAERVAGLLWKEEAVSVLVDYGNSKGIGRLRSRELHERVAASVPLDKLRDVVRRRLLDRGDWTNRHDALFVGPFAPRGIKA